MGVDFEKSAPEIYKKGLLKKEIRKFKGGEFQAAMNELMKGFKIAQLRRAFLSKEEYKKYEDKKAKRLE